MWWKSLIIIIGTLILFFSTFLLNRKVPKPNGCEISEKCENCQMANCYIKKKVENGDNNEGQ